MIFVTVGTLTPFDRLVRTIDELVGAGKLAHPVFAQIGNSELQPRHMEWTRTLDRATFEARVKSCSSIVSHAGMGTIIQALAHRKPLLVMPRLRRYGEHVNDHQVTTAQRFEAANHVLAAYAAADLESKLSELTCFKPVARVADPEAVASRVSRFLGQQQPR